MTAEFHPSFTLLGTQPSFVVAMRGGLLAKINRPVRCHLLPTSRRPPHDLPPTSPHLL